MSDDARKAELARLLQRTEELAETHRGLRRLRADVAEHAAQVHDRAAQVHEELGIGALLDPADLRAHAAAEREIVAEERAALARDDDGRPCG